MSHRSIRLALWLTALGFVAGGSGGALAAGEPIELKAAEAEVGTLAAWVKDKKKPNEDLIGTLGAVQNAFFHIAPPPDEAPKDPGADASEEDKKAYQAALKTYEQTQKAWQEKVKAFQEAALDQLFKALKVVEINAKNKDNLRTDVNLKAAQTIGEILGSPDLAKYRDAKEVEKLRAERAKHLMDVLANDFGKEAGKKELQIAVGVLEATFAALGKTNEPKALDWLLKEYTHTRNGQFEEERLVAAHKAMVMFTSPTPVPGKKRHEIVDLFIKGYAGVEANAQQTGGSDAKARAQAQASKAFWDKIKTGVVAVINYYATAPGGGPPTKDGQGMTTLKDLSDWWRDNDNPRKAPWVDPKEPVSK
jgi:hypothetical protein